MKHHSTSYQFREKAVKVFSPSEETLMTLRLFARAFSPNSVLLSEN